MPRACIAFATGLEPVATTWLTPLFDAVGPGLALAYRPGREAAVPTLRHLRSEGPAIALHGLAGHAAAPVRLNGRRLGAVLVA